MPSFFFISKFSLYCECCILSFGWFSGTWILCADVSERSVCSIFISHANNENNWDETARVFIQVYLYLYEYLSNLIPVILLVHTIYKDGTECSETSEHKIQTVGNYKKRGGDSTMLSFPRKGRVKNWIKVALSWGTCGSLLWYQAFLLVSVSNFQHC